MYVKIFKKRRKNNALILDHIFVPLPIMIIILNMATCLICQIQVRKLLLVEELYKNI